MEPGPPMQSFQNRRHVDSWEQSQTKLMDERWLDVLMWKVRSKDSYLESRKRLSGGAGKGKQDQSSRSDAKSEKEKEKEKKQSKGGGKGANKKGPPAEVDSTAA